MPKYLTRVSFTTEGVKGLQKETAKQRRDAVAKLVESAGGRLEAFYFAFGADDGVGIYDLPDNVTAASLSIASKRRRPRPHEHDPARDSRGDGSSDRQEREVSHSVRSKVASARPHHDPI
jgi:uncharacterized protein with GYD domain